MSIRSKTVKHYCNKLCKEILCDVIKATCVDPFGLVILEAKCECGIIHSVISRK